MYKLETKEQLEDYYLRLQILFSASFLKTLIRSESQKINRQFQQISQFVEEKLDPTRTIVVQDIKVEKPASMKYKIDTKQQQLDPMEQRQFGDEMDDDMQEVEILTQEDEKYVKFDANKLSPEDIQKITQEWKQMFQAHFGQINQIKFKFSQAWVEFSKDKYVKAIKSILIRKAWFSESAMLYRGEYYFNQMKEQQDKVQGDLDKFLEKLGDVQFLPSFLQKDIMTNSDVCIDTFSLNRYCLSDKQLLVGFKYTQRTEGKNYTRYTTLLPKLAILPQILLLMFGSNPKLIADINQEKQSTRYEYVQEDSGQLYLDYFLTKQTISQINEVRKELRRKINNQDGQQQHKPNDEIWQQIKDVLKSEKVKYSEKEEWEQSFNKEWYVKQSQQNGNNNYQVSAENKNKSNFLLQQIDQSSMKFLEEEQKVTVVSWETSFFPLIETPQLTNEIDVNTKEGRTQYKNYLESYNAYKKFRFDQLEKTKLKISTKDAQICCNVQFCDKRICSVRSIKGKTCGGQFREIENLYEMNIQYGLPFDKNDPFCELSNFSSITTIYKNNYELFGCLNGHILGFRPKQGNQQNDRKWLVTLFSNLNIIYPDLVTKEKFSIKYFDLQQVLTKEVEINNSKRNKSEILECFICSRKYNNDKEIEFVQHFSRDNYHKQKLEEYLKSMQDNDLT